MTDKIKEELDKKRSKNRWSLIPWSEMEEVAEIMTLGAKKYDVDNWKKLDIPTYQDALLRHVTAYMRGEKQDREDGYSHLAHAICNCMFLSWFENRRSNGQKN